MNKMGPSTEPCGTPYELVNGCDKEELILTEEVLKIYDLYDNNMCPTYPVQLIRLIRLM